jgi:hypothetical protein
MNNPMSNKVYYITEFSSQNDRFKFQAQIESIFDEKGFVPVKYPGNYISRFFTLIRLPFILNKETIIFFIHPLYSVTSRMILSIARLKRSSVVCIISDLNGLRDENISLDKEINYLKDIKYFVFHNNKMRSLIEARTGKKVSVNIQLFDLLFAPPAVQRINSNEVVFAGNTSKCPFLKDLDKIQNIKWMVYSSSKIPAASNVKHVMLFDDIQDRAMLMGSYGLIWEGDSVENITGLQGKYLEWVTPLKLSNYLLNGLPVITHVHAAIADLVNREKIGFCVSSLFEIEGKIRDIDEDQYQQMQENARKFSGKISRGHYMSEAIDGIISKIRSKQEDQLS